MAKRIRIGLTILVCSLVLCGCNLTLGPKIETRYVIVKAGLPVEILENETVRCRVLKYETGDAVKQDIGGWIAMPPAHWQSVKNEITKLRGEK